MPYKKIIGIYKIQSKVKPERIYIGSAISIKERFCIHKNALIKKKHHSPKLQNHVNKYGLDDLDFFIVEICLIENILEKEQYYLDTLNPYFNIYKKARSCLGVKHTEECKIKNRERQLGEKGNNYGKHFKRSVETCQLISKSLQGKTPWNKGLTRETDKRIEIYSKSQEGRKLTEETCKNISNSLLGKKHLPTSESTKELIRKSKIGKPSWNKGLHLSEQHKKNISISHLKLNKN